MKKIKEFFKIQKNRFVSWYKETYYPVKRVILLLMLCSLVAFGLGLMLYKKPYKQASAAVDTDVSYITVSYQPQFFYDPDPTVDVSNTVFLCSDVRFVIRGSSIFYIAPSGELLLSSGSLSTKVYAYTFDKSAKVNVYKIITIPLNVSSTFDSENLSSLSSGESILTSVRFINEIRNGGGDNDSSNFYWLTFYGKRTDDTTSNASVAYGSVFFYLDDAPYTDMNLRLTENEVPYFNWSYLSKTTGSGFYLKGYEDGYNAGLKASLSDISPWQVLVQGVDDLFNAKIFGNVSIGLLFELGLGIILFGFMIKLFFGG